MTHHEHHHRRHGEMDWDEDDERGHRGYPGDQRRSGGRGSWVQDRGDYGGWASGEGQGEFARDGYSAQGQFSNQRVAQYGDQGYGQDYGRQGIGWQNRHDDDNQAFRARNGLGAGSTKRAGVSRRTAGRRLAGSVWPRSRTFWITFHAPAGRLRRRRERLARRFGRLLGTRRRWRSRHWWKRLLAARAPAGWGAQGHGGHGQRWEGSGTGYSAAGSWMAGPHSGRGPQGYQRSDARIEEDVCEHLTHHGMLDATGIQVQVENGEVTLTGTVESRQAKRLAEDILDSISGVRDIHNQLRVQRYQGDHQNPFMAQTQMGQGTGRGSNGQSQSRGQTQRNETKAGASNS